MKTTFGFGGEAAASATALRQQRIEERYGNLRHVKNGGMGVLYRGIQFALDRPVALKTVHPPHLASPLAVARFEKEVSSLAKLSHPNIVTILDTGMHDLLGRVIVMEWIEGCSLQEHLFALAQQDMRMGLGEILAIAVDTAKGIKYLHKQRILHRDLKPGNIMLPESHDPTAKLIDMGVGRSLVDENSLTATGDFVGTKLWAAPEQMELKDLDERADIYSFGLILYEMFTGQHPFRKIVREKHNAAVSLRPVSQFRPEVPRVLCDLVSRLTAYDRDERLASADAVVCNLEQIARGLA